MPSGYTNAHAAALQDVTFGVAALAGTVTPLKMALETTAGTATAAGTELGSTTRQTITMGAAAGTPPVSSNTAALTFTAGASGTVVAAAIYDSTASPGPVRKAYGPLGTARSVAAADALGFAVGAVTFTTTPSP